MIAQYCPSCSHHKDCRRPCPTQRQLHRPYLDVVRYDGPCPQPWVNTSQLSSCRLAQRVQSLQHHRRVVCTEPRRRVQCYRSRNRRTDTRSVKLGPEREHSVATTARDLSPRPKWACWREGTCRLSGCRKGRRYRREDLRGNAAIAEGDRVVGYCSGGQRRGRTTRSD
ncbi:hypothetical protein EV363DRAFT_1341199 [Boletus edulis]|nr:hypothetical protein EV363DRAFT_1377803 [Boletus edulis]KAF8127291.1 hypothetical protein EV363DRAFT_1346541 [Boletus edulis]KAF8128222.1 hypothetical protein EV363DRAFT_1341199 [Boletus edulis]